MAVLDNGFGLVGTGFFVRLQPRRLTVPSLSSSVCKPGGSNRSRRFVGKWETRSVFQAGVSQRLFHKFLSCDRCGPVFRRQVFATAVQYRPGDPRDLVRKRNVNDIRMCA